MYLFSCCHTRTKISFGIQIDDLALSSTHVECKLTGHTQCMSTLSLARTKFTEQFRDGSCFNATSQNLVQLVATRRNLNHTSTLLLHFQSRFELIATAIKFTCRFTDLFGDE